MSVNLVSPEMLVKANFVDIYSGKSVDKSEVFEYFYSDVERAPLITESPISMASRLIHTYETDNEFCFILDHPHLCS